MRKLSLDLDALAMEPFEARGDTGAHGGGSTCACRSHRAAAIR